MKKIYTSVIFLDLLQTNFKNFQYRKCITLHVTLPRLKMAQWFWRTRFLKVVNVFSLFCNDLPLEKGEALHLEKLDSPSSKDALCQVLLKLAQWFWRRRFFSFVKIFSLFRNYLPLEKGGALHLNKLESPSPKDALCQVWLNLAQWFWRRR